ncbi:hypothetical protein IW261DRAFT_1413784 [Armillaria novae-zelandiae]|uniref:Uncharacterized protein n=1 Tax=Armillaria novae-zelandiae TaxID=153914 RepID=A0AA39PVT0_9AGAR|nr:hypothetical protein IW261DRAFT_1413784 [Armillaria novae-zelandiae]
MITYWNGDIPGRKGSVALVSLMGVLGILRVNTQSHRPSPISLSPTPAPGTKFNKLQFILSLYAESSLDLGTPSVRPTPRDRDGNTDKDYSRIATSRPVSLMRKRNRPRAPPAVLVPPKHANTITTLKHRLCHEGSLALSPFVPSPNLFSACRSGMYHNDVGHSSRSRSPCRALTRGQFGDTASGGKSRGGGSMVAAPKGRVERYRVVE